jgi:hypothetical protein
MAVTIDGSANTVTADATLTTKLTTATGSAPSYSARAWVNFNGTGTVAIRASGNVSSITDNGVGTYRVNLTSAMPDVNSSPIVSSDVNASGGLNAMIVSIVSSSAYDVYTYGIAGGGLGAYRDTASVFFSLHR